MKYPESMLGRMFGGPIPTAQDGGGSFFIDRDGKLFRFILNFLRNDKLTLPDNFAEVEQLKEEVDFYQIAPMMKALAEFENAREQATEIRERAEAGNVIAIWRSSISSHPGELKNGHFQKPFLSWYFHSIITINV